ncbi:hypothetical protein D9M69_653550 [compost metagenome]
MASRAAAGRHQLLPPRLQCGIGFEGLVSRGRVFGEVLREELDIGLAQSHGQRPHVRTNPFPTGEALELSRQVRRGLASQARILLMLRVTLAAMTADASIGQTRPRPTIGLAGLVGRGDVIHQAIEIESIPTVNSQ